MLIREFSIICRPIVVPMYHPIIHPLYTYIKDLDRKLKDLENFYWLFGDWPYLPGGGLIIILNWFNSTPTFFIYFYLSILPGEKLHGRDRLSHKKKAEKKG